MKLLLFGTLFIGWSSYFLCQRTLPSAMGDLIAESEQNGAAAGTKGQFFTATYIGQLQSLFALSYSTSFLITGIMSDMVNVRILFSVCLAGSGLLLAIFPWTEGHHSLGLLLYFLFGLVQGCGWPSAGKILRQMYRPSELGVPWGVISTSSSFAAFFSPFLVTTIATSSGSWKYSFYMLGASSISISLPIAFITNMTSDKPPSSKKRQENEGKQTSSSLRWFHVFLVRELWGVMAVHSVLWLVKASVQDWGQLYLVQEGGFDRSDASKTVGVMQFGGVIGKIMLGYISNWAMRSKGMGLITTSGKTNRTVVLLISLLLLLMVLLRFATLNFSEEHTLIVSLVIFGIGVFAEGAVIIVNLTSMDVVPESLSGTGQATSAAASQMIGRSLAGWPLSVMIGWIGWRQCFLALCVSSVLGIVASCFLVNSFHAQSLKKKA